MAKESDNKVSLTQLLGTDWDDGVKLYRDEPERKKKHEVYRTPRHRLINSAGMGYDRPLAGNATVDAKYHELAREFVNNGMHQTNAYAAVYGAPYKTARAAAYKIFNSTWMRAKIREILLGTDSAEELPKEYLIERLMQMIDNNIMDYIADDGTYLNVEEIKALPSWVQQQIKKLTIRNETVPVAVKDENGKVVLDENGQAHYVEVRQQHVHLELYDKQRAMDILAKAMRWITSDNVNNINVITPETMVQAEARVKQLRREEIEGKAERVTSD